MTTRLTTALRDRIRCLTVEAAFKDRESAYKAEENALALEAYHATFTPAERTTAAMLPDHWLRLDNCLRFNANGYDITLTMTDRVPVPSARSNYCSRLGSLTGDLGDRVQAFAHKVEKCRNDRMQANREMTAFLASFRTLEKLQEAWPEGADFYASLSNNPAEKAGLPAVKVESINKMLGLKPKSAAAAAV